MSQCERESHCLSFFILFLYIFGSIMEMPEEPSAVQSHTHTGPPGSLELTKGEDLDKGVNEAAAFPEGSLPSKPYYMHNPVFIRRI